MTEEQLIKLHQTLCEQYYSLQKNGGSVEYSSPVGVGLRERLDFVWSEIEKRISKDCNNCRV